MDYYIIKYDPHYPADPTGLTVRRVPADPPKPEPGQEPETRPGLRFDLAGDIVPQPAEQQQ
jgi:hypothetical protein